MIGCAFCSCGKHADTFFSDGTFVQSYSRPALRMRLETWRAEGRVDEVDYRGLLHSINNGNLPEKASLGFTLTKDCEALRKFYTGLTGTIEDIPVADEDLLEDVTLGVVDKDSLQPSGPHTGRAGSRPTSH